MIEFDPTRLDLAREFRARPFGVHSGDLQAVLTRMRGQPIQGKHCLIMTRSYAEYALARMAGEPPRPELLPGLVFDRVEDAEWAAFRLRWRELSGEDLPLDPPLEPGAPVDASTVMPRSVLMGYAEEVSVAPGERVGFKVSGRGCPRYRADIVRLYAPDTGPDAPGFREVVVPTPVGGEYPVRWQDIQPGSYVVVPRAPALDPAGSFTLQALVWPTRPARGRQALLGAWREGAAAGYGLGLDEAGALALWLGDGARRRTAAPCSPPGRSPTRAASPTTGTTTTWPGSRRTCSAASPIPPRSRHAGREPLSGGERPRAAPGGLRRRRPAGGWARRPRRAGRRGDRRRAPAGARPRPRCLRCPGGGSALAGRRGR